MKACCFWIATLACYGVWVASSGQAVCQSEVGTGSPVVASMSHRARYGNADMEDAFRGDEAGRRPGEGGLVVRSDVRRIVVSSGRCTGMTQSEAQAELEKVMAEQRAKQLCQLAWDCAGIRLTPAEVVAEWSWLSQQAGVQERVTRELCEARDYGWIAQRDMEISLPYAVLAHWTARLQSRSVYRWQRFLMAAAGSVVGLIVALAVAIFLDRKTGGYYREVIVVGVLVMLALLGAAFWVGVVGSVL